MSCILQTMATAAVQNMLGDDALARAAQA